MLPAPTACAAPTRSAHRSALFGVPNQAAQWTAVSGWPFSAPSWQTPWRADFAFFSAACSRARPASGAAQALGRSAVRGRAPPPADFTDSLCRSGPIAQRALQPEGAPLAQISQRQIFPPGRGARFDLTSRAARCGSGTRETVRTRLREAGAGGATMRPADQHLGDAHAILALIASIPRRASYLDFSIRHSTSCVACRGRDRRAQRQAPGATPTSRHQSLGADSGAPARAALRDMRAELDSDAAAGRPAGMAEARAEDDA